MKELLKIGSINFQQPKNRKIAFEEIKHYKKCLESIKRENAEKAKFRKKVLAAMSR